MNGGSHSPVGGGEVPVPQENFPEWRCSLAQLGSTIRGGAFDDSTQARNSHGISSGTIQIRNNSVVTGPSELWGRVITTINTTEQVTILASILANQEGRWFVSNLARKEAELCIEILAQVSCGPHTLTSSGVSDGFARGSQKITSKRQRNRPSSSH